MAQTHEGAMKANAKRLGVTYEEYQSLQNAGLKRCQRCKAWKPIGEFDADRSRQDGRTHSCTPCRRVSHPQKPSPPSFRGRRHTAEVRRKMSEQRKGNQYAVGHTKSPAQIAVGKDRSRKARGPRHHNWRGGVTPEHLKIRQSPEYVTWRRAVFERDGYRCVSCGDDRGGNLRAHHIQPFATAPTLRMIVSNGATLCNRCHELLHTSAARIRRTA